MRHWLPFLPCKYIHIGRDYYIISISYHVHIMMVVLRIRVLCAGWPCGIPVVMLLFVVGFNVVRCGFQQDKAQYDKDSRRFRWPRVLVTFMSCCCCCCCCCCSCSCCCSLLLLLSFVVCWARVWLCSSKRPCCCASDCGEASKNTHAWRK